MGATPPETKRRRRSASSSSSWCDEPQGQSSPTQPRHWDWRQVPRQAPPPRHPPQPAAAGHRPWLEPQQLEAVPGDTHISGPPPQRNYTRMPRRSTGGETSVSLLSPATDLLLTPLGPQARDKQPCRLIRNFRSSSSLNLSGLTACSNPSGAPTDLSRKLVHKAPCSSSAI